MKKTHLVALLAIVTIFAGSVIGCDNRSQLEKDADKAAAKIKANF